MTTSALLADLQRRGVHVVADGDSLRCRGPRGVMTPADLEALREHKTEILAEIRAPHRRGDGVGDAAGLVTAAAPTSPVSQPHAGWLSTVAKVRRLAASNGVTLDTGSMEAATWLFLAAEGERELRRGTDPAIAREWATAIVAGRATGRLGPEGRPIVTPIGSNPST